MLVSLLLLPAPAYCQSCFTRITLKFDPPLREAPQFGDFILPPAFYEPLQVTEELLIDNFTTVQGPSGLKDISFEISSDDPEVATSVYAALIEHYPAFSAGEADFVTGFPRFAIDTNIIHDDEFTALKDGKLTSTEMLGIILDRIIDLPEYSILSDLGVDFDKMDVIIDDGQLGIEVIKDEAEKWLPIGISEDLINKFISGKINAGELEDTIYKSLQEHLLQPFRFKIPGVMGASLNIGDLADTLTNLKDLKNLSLDDFLKGGIRFEVEVASQDELLAIIAGVKDLIRGFGFNEREVKNILQKIPGIRDIDNIRADQIDDLLKGTVRSVKNLIDGDKRKPFERQVKHFLKSLKAKILPKPTAEISSIAPATPAETPEPGEPTSPCPKETPSPSEDITGKLTIHLRSNDEKFDPGQNGYLIITEKIITSDDRANLRDGNISPSDFAETLSERLIEAGWLGYNFELTLTDNTAEYKLIVKDRNVAFEFQPAS